MKILFIILFYLPMISVGQSISFKDLRILMQGDLEKCELMLSKKNWSLNDSNQAGWVEFISNIDKKSTITCRFSDDEDNHITCFLISKIIYERILLEAKQQGFKIVETISTKQGISHIYKLDDGKNKLIFDFTNKPKGMGFSVGIFLYKEFYQEYYPFIK